MPVVVVVLGRGMIVMYSPQQAEEKANQKGKQQKSGEKGIGVLVAIMVVIVVVFNVLRNVVLVVPSGNIRRMGLWKRWMMGVRRQMYVNR